MTNTMNALRGDWTCHGRLMPRHSICFMNSSLKRCLHTTQPIDATLEKTKWERAYVSQKASERQKLDLLLVPLLCTLLHGSSQDEVMVPVLFSHWCSWSTVLWWFGRAYPPHEECSKYSWAANVHVLPLQQGGGPHVHHVHWRSNIQRCQMWRCSPLFQHAKAQRNIKSAFILSIPQHKTSSVKLPLISREEWKHAASWHTS